VVELVRPSVPPFHCVPAVGSIVWGYNIDHKVILCVGCMFWKVGGGLFIERTSTLASRKPSTRKPARLAII
jgi:hypothetical protein